jgi:AcrR family transcriptional regulator
LGRTNRSLETRDRIVDAFVQCVIDLGLEKASMGEVGARLGLDRSSIHYYFRTREELLALAAQRVTHTYIERFQRTVDGFSAEDRPRQLIEYLFGAGFHRPDLSVLIDEFSSAGNRDPAIQALVAGMYRSIEDSIGAEIDREFPEAPREARRDAIYAIQQLLEGCTVMKSLGFPASRWQAGRAAAAQILEQLGRSGTRVRTRARPATRTVGRRA